jgi:2-(1,2-epoxy-1,2-dihydrophenyl)acetyl-CoA isomerase
LTYQTLLYSVTDDVATITLNRPERMNALSVELMIELADAIGRTQKEGARALVLTGASTSFCSGADLTAGMPDDLGALLDEYYHPVVDALAGLDMPVISAINGPAVGAGLSIALAADIVVMARSAYLLLAFANIALVPDAGATWLIANSAGRAKALVMALMAERISS